MPSGARPWVWPVVGSVGAIVVSPERGYAGLALAPAAAALLWAWIKPATSRSVTN